tara:strand:- start:1896 stop:2294 length:399 start_codon:yes stop_codon:yes gene_type:complete
MDNFNLKKFVEGKILLKEEMSSEHNDFAKKYLKGYQFTSEGGKLIVKGNINLKNKKENIKLPNNLTVDGQLLLSGSDIKELPSGLKVFLLSISSTSIRRLPNDLKVEQNLIINNTEIDKIPKGVEIGGNIFL